MSKASKQKTHDTTAIDPSHRGLTVRELAARWNCSYDTVWHMVRAGEIAALRLGRVYRVMPEAIAAAEAAMTTKVG